MVHNSQGAGDSPIKKGVLIVPLSFLYGIPCPEDMTKGTDKFGSKREGVASTHETLQASDH